MATTKQPRKPAKAGAHGNGRAEATLERLNSSLDAAQDAAKLLRKDVRRGTRDIAKNLETMIASTRKDAAKLAKAVRKDLVELEKAVSSPPRKPARAGSTRGKAASSARRVSAKKPRAASATK